MNLQTIELPALSVRAALSSINDDARTVDVIFSTGAAVDRMDPWTGKRYREVLSMDPKHVRLDRLNSGAPVLDSHSGWSVGNVFGVVERGSAVLSDGQGLASLRFSKRDAVTPIWQDIRDEIVANVSIGYRVHKFEEVLSKDGIPTRTAIDWEPFEISMVPMPADVGARVRAEDRTDLNPCVVVTRAVQEQNMDNEQQTTSATATGARAAAQPQDSPNAEQLRADAVAQERARITDIQKAVRVAGLDAAVAEDLVGRGLSLDQARAAIFERMAANQAPTQTRGAIEVGESGRDKFIRGASNWLLVRSGLAGIVAKHEGTTADKIQPGECRGMSLLDLAREVLERSGVSTRGLSRMDIASLAFSRSGNHQTTSDFSTLLENALHKVLRAAYATQSDTWSRFCGVGSVTDFRSHNWYRLGALGSLDSLNEHGEFKNKAIPDAEKATFAATTKGNIIAITREVVVNDDIGAVMRLTEMLGRAAKLTIEKAVFAQLTANSGLGPTQSDTNPLFHSGRSNINTSAAAITVASIEADRAVMRSQRDPNSQEYLDINPTVLLVPVGKRGDALTINEAMFDPADSKFQKPNTVRGLFREVIDTPRLSGTRRYLFADPTSAPVFLVSFLEGVQEPVLETQDGWRTSGVEMKARLDFGVDVVDYRGAVTNAGA